MNDKDVKETENRRNGYGKKTIKTGEVDIKVPRGRDGFFNPELIPKRKKDVSAIENKVISMYARGMSQRDISSTIEDIYGFSVSNEMDTSYSMKAQNSEGSNVRGEGTLFTFKHKL